MKRSRIKLVVGGILLVTQIGCGDFLKSQTADSDSDLGNKSRVDVKANENGDVTGCFSATAPRNKS